MKTLEVLKQARGLIEKPEDWGQFALNHNGGARTALSVL